MNLEEAKAKLEKYGQSHILKSYERLDQVGKEKLLHQLDHIDFDEMEKLYEKTKETIAFDNVKIEPMKSVIPENLTEAEREELKTLGEELIKQGKLGVVTLAGGQGTRLGHSGPKGTFDLGLPSHKSLFEILCDGIRETYEKYGTIVHWYIMTSRENNDATVAFFEEHHYFGYPKEGIMFFEQSELPMIDENGKLIIDEDGLIKEASNGSGSVYESLEKRGMLANMKQNGIEYVFIGGVDNVLVRMTDPSYLGFMAKHQLLGASKTIVKAYPEERVGVFCKKNGIPSVIEYTEIPDDMARLQNPDGSLVYGESHMMLNMFHIKALEHVAKCKLEYHVAHKKSGYMNEEGEYIKPEAPNAYKFETLFFDAFPMIEPDKVGLYRGKREEDFSPVKNAEGVDSPETARRDYILYHKLQEETV